MRLLSQQWSKVARGAAKKYLKINRNVFAFLYHSENLNHPLSQGKSLSTFKIQPPKPSSISNPSLFCLGCLFCDLHSRLETNVRFIKRKSPGLIQRPIQCKKMPGTFCDTLRSNELTLSIHFISLVSCYTPWKHQKTSGFLIFSERKESVAWNELLENIFQ